MSPEALRRLAASIVATESSISASFAAELATVMRQVERRIRLLVPDPTATGAIRLAELTQIRAGIRRALEQAGYGALVGRQVTAPLSDLARQILGQIPIEGSIASRLTALQYLQGANLLHEGETAAQALWQAVMRGVLGARTRAQLDDALAQQIDRSEAQIRTLYDTSLTVYSRQVEAVQAGDAPETTFLYLGPDDDVTRPFCAKHVGKEYTRAEIDALDNGQLPNVFLTGGGYNCRHLWLEVDRSATGEPEAEAA